MIVVKVELWPKGNEQAARELSRVYVRRADTVDETHANYEAAVMRKGEKLAPWTLFLGGNKTRKPVRNAWVRNYSGRSYPVLFLIFKALKALYPEW